MEPFITTIITALISSLVGALVGALVSKAKTTKKAIETEREVNLLTLTMVCRLAIYSDKFSVDEKIEAYIVYRDICHENHQTKTYMDKLVGMDVDEYIERHRKD